MAEPHESRVYSDLAHFYDAVFGWAFVDHEHEVLEALPFRPGHRVLEVGLEPASLSTPIRPTFTSSVSIPLPTCSRERSRRHAKTTGVISNSSMATPSNLNLQTAASTGS